MNGAATPGAGIPIFTKLPVTASMPAWNFCHPAMTKMTPMAMRTAVTPQPGWIPQIPRMSVLLWWYRTVGDASRVLGGDDNMRVQWRRRVVAYFPDVQ